MDKRTVEDDLTTEAFPADIRLNAATMEAINVYEKYRKTVFCFLCNISRKMVALRYRCLVSCMPTERSSNIRCNCENNASNTINS